MDVALLLCSPDYSDDVLVIVPLLLDFDIGTMY